jgi:hypothetical protein
LRYSTRRRLGALLTEPWTDLLIRVFSKSAIILLTESANLAKISSSHAAELALRAEDCIRALKYLGRKSDTARVAGDTLDGALRDQQVEQAARAGTNGKLGDILNHSIYTPSNLSDGTSPDLAHLSLPLSANVFDDLRMPSDANDSWLGLGHELAPELAFLPGHDGGVGVPVGTTEWIV